MDKLWIFWKFICCGEGQRAYRSASWAKKNVFCSRNVYYPLTPVSDYLELPFFIRGQYITAIVSGDDVIMLDDGKLQYTFNSDETEIKSHNKEATTYFRVCCGCVVEDPEDTFCYLRERPAYMRSMPNESGEHAYSLAVSKIEELNNEVPVGMLKLSSFSPDTSSERPEREKSYQKVLKSLVPIPLLICSIPDESYKQWVELVDYKHLSIRTYRKMTVTEKMLNCGFLNVNALLTNPEELENFKGFGLLIGRFDENRFTFERFFQEIEKWIGKSPSLECFGLLKQNIREDGSFPEVLERLKGYSPTGEIVRVSPSPFTVEAMILDDEKQVAILFISHFGICFVKGGYEKWVRVLDYLDNSIAQ